MFAVQRQKAFWSIQRYVEIFRLHRHALARKPTKNHTSEHLVFLAKLFGNFYNSIFAMIPLSSWSILNFVQPNYRRLLLVNRIVE